LGPSLSLLLYIVRKVISKKRIKRINLIRVIGLIRSSKTVYCKVSRRTILLIGVIKYTIERHLGSR